MADRQMDAEIVVQFDEAASRQSLNSGDNLPTLFSKVKKFFSDLKTVAFSGSYNDLSDKPESLPANGGNADTVGGLHVNEIASNPNLLINPDFRVNQRNKSGVITETGYFVDRWQLVNGTVTINADGSLTLNGTIVQILENAVGGTTTPSASAGTASYDDITKTFTLTASGETIAWVKLELGSTATPFVPPEPATELVKCQRYYINLNANKGQYVHYGIGTAESSTTLLITIPYPTTMRLCPSIQYGGYFKLIPCDNLRAINVTALEMVGSDFNYNSSILLRVTSEETLTVGEIYWFSGGHGSIGDDSSYIALSAEIY